MASASARLELPATSRIAPLLVAADRCIAPISFVRGGDNKMVARRQYRRPRGPRNFIGWVKARVPGSKGKLGGPAKAALTRVNCCPKATPRHENFLVHSGDSPPARALLPLRKRGRRDGEIGRAHV